MLTLVEKVAPTDATVLVEGETFTGKDLADLRRNVWPTISRRTFGSPEAEQALHCTILTMGAVRILFSNDYPYEDYAEGGEFIDPVPISESDRCTIAYNNVKALYML